MYLHRAIEIRAYFLRVYRDKSCTGGRHKCIINALDITEHCLRRRTSQHSDSVTGYKRELFSSRKCKSLYSKFALIMLLLSLAIYIQVLGISIVMCNLFTVQRLECSAVSVQPAHCHVFGITHWSSECRHTTRELQLPLAHGTAVIYVLLITIVYLKMQPENYAIGKENHV